MIVGRPVWRSPRAAPRPLSLRRSPVADTSAFRAKEPSHFLKVRLGRRKDHQELEVFGDVDETVLGKLGYEGD
jgi:hypothetical protein